MSLFSGIIKIPDLRKRVLFTLAMIAVYRIGIFVTTPGVDRRLMGEIVSRNGSNSFLGLLSIFSGGAFENVSIFALNIMPYVSASIIISLMGMVVKPLEELRKEGEAGNRKINQYTRYGTIVLSLVQAFGIAMWLESQNEGSQSLGDLVAHPGWGFRLMTMLSLTTGTAFLMWLGEQITEQGLGNGISVLIFAGIIANLPANIGQTGELVKSAQIQPIDLMIVGVVALIVTAFIVFFERAQRKVPIQYAKRTVGSNVYGGQTSHLPLKPNMSGVVPPIFASAILTFPMTLSNLKIPYMSRINTWVQPGSWGYMVAFSVLTIFFAFFYTAITFQPVEVADNLKKQQAFIPGVRPGKSTAEYLDALVTRLTSGGAVYLAVVCMVPTILQQKFHVPFYFGGTSLIIVVGVALELWQQVESHLISQHYEQLTSGEDEVRLSGRKKAAST